MQAGASGGCRGRPYRCFPTECFIQCAFIMQDFNKGYYYIPSTVPFSYQNICCSFLCRDMTNVTARLSNIISIWWSSQMSQAHLCHRAMCVISWISKTSFLLNDLKTPYSTRTSIGSYLWIVGLWETLSSGLPPRAFCLLCSENVPLSP